MPYLIPAAFDHNGYHGMCGYQPTCCCRFLNGYVLNQCPDYCEMLPRHPEKAKVYTQKEMEDHFKAMGYDKCKCKPESEDDDELEEPGQATLSRFIEV